ncbi:MAG: NACHT domain-containing protein [Blastocatellia bacterium]
MEKKALKKRANIKKNSFSPTERYSLINSLSLLPLPVFDNLISILNPISGVISPSTVPQRTRISELISWIESSETYRSENIQTILEMLTVPETLSNKVKRFTAINPNDNAVSKLFKTYFEEFSIKLPNKLIHWLINNDQELDFLNIAATLYKKQIEERCNFIKILGMPSPVSVKKVYVKVNLLNKLSSQTYQSLNDFQEYFDYHKKKLSKNQITTKGIDIVNKKPKLMVLGKPGAGKTTFLRHIALQAIEGKLKKNRLPIFISLKDLSDSKQNILDFLTDQLSDCQMANAKTFIEFLLHQGKYIFLFDGLDEVNKDKEDYIIREVRNFSQKFSENQFVISCRVGAYSNYFEQFTDVEMADFDDEQIKMFIHNWFDKDEKTASLCWQQLNEDSSIKELGSTPLLLTLLCITFTDTGNFPKKRSDLYKEAIDALLKKWDASRRINRGEIYKNLSPLDKERLFSQIALRTFEKTQYFLEKSTLEQYIGDFIQHLPSTKQEEIKPDSEIILKAIEVQHGLFVNRARNIYSFSHLTFQEYFAARYIVDNIGNDTLDQYVVVQNLSNYKWREVFLLVAGLLANAEKYIFLIRKNIDLLLDSELKVFFDKLFSDTNFQQAVDSVLKTKNVKQSYYRSAKIFLALFFKTNRIFDQAESLLKSLNTQLDDLSPDIGYRLIRIAREFYVYRSNIIDIIPKIEKNLENYLVVNCLLLDCLNVSFISKDKRQEVLDKILLIPQTL